MDEILQELYEIFTAERLAIGAGSLFVSTLFSLFVNWLSKEAPPLSEMASNLLELLDDPNKWQLSQSSTGITNSDSIEAKKVKDPTKYQPDITIIPVFPMCYHGAHNLKNDLSDREMRMVQKRANEILQILIKENESKETKLKNTRSKEALKDIKNLTGN
jgi:hypothetical protein